MAKELSIEYVSSCKLQVNVIDIIATVTNSTFFQFSLGESKFLHVYMQAYKSTK